MIASREPRPGPRSVPAPARAGRPLSGRSWIPSRPDSAALAAAGALVYLPLLVGVAFGLLLGGETSPGSGYGPGRLFTHNLRVAAITVVGGVLSLGLLAIIAACVGGFVNGFGMGVVIGDDGIGELLRGMPHFLPETGGAVLFVAVGIAPVTRVLWRRVLDRPVEPTRTAIARWALLTAISVALLAVAALLEAPTV